MEAHRAVGNVLRRTQASKEVATEEIMYPDTHAVQLKYFISLFVYMLGRRE